MELSEWMAYDKAYGLPDLNVLSARQQSTMAGLWSKRRQTPYDFLPDAYRPEGPPPVASAQENLSRFRAATAHLRKPQG